MFSIFNRKSTSVTALLMSAAMLLTSCSGGNGDSEGTGTEAGTNASGGQPASPNSDTGWSYSQLAMGGGGFVSGVFSTSEEGLYYARTDVGGAYRWDNSQGKWVSLSYNITEEDVGLMGIDGMAIDPDEPKNIYLLAGTSYFSNGKSCVMISKDYGNTFETIDVTELIKVSGNGMGRQNGERIAIDPVDKNIIFAGGRTGGLIKSVDGGKTWASVSSVADATSLATTNNNGICSLIIDPDSSDGSKCSRIYAAVSKGSSDSIVVSNDGGDSWSPVSGLPDSLYPQRMRLDGQGNLIIVYGDTEGPHGGDSSKGGIFRMNMESGAVEDISPAAQTYGDVAISTKDPNKMVAVTENVWVTQPNGSYGDNFYTTTDGGKNWKSVNESMTMDPNGINWIESYAIHWCGCLMIDQFDDNKIKVVSGNGIFGCDNIWDDAPAFYFDSKGIEETVPSELVTVPDENGGKIITSVYDYDGFVNTDAFEYGYTHSSKAGSMTDIAVAFGNTDVMVKCGSEGFYYTTDGGEKWNKARKTPANGTNSGAVAVSADGKRFFWIPDGGTSLCYSDDNGDSWTEATGIFLTKDVVADPVNSDYIYAASGSAFYVSSDGGKSFTKTLSLLTEARITVVPGKEGVVYIPAMGMQYSSDHGNTFERKGTAAGCTAVGIGKGKTDSSPDVIYIWGRPTTDDIMGIYASEDDGQTWEAVTQGTMQFGGMGNGKFLKGDCNTYGRCYISSVGLGVVVCDKKNK